MVVPFRKIIIFSCVLPGFYLQPNLLLAAADTGVVAGKVTDAGNGLPIEFVNVTVAGTNHGVASDKAGRFSLAGLTAGSYIFQFSAVGYVNTELTNIAVVRNQTTLLEVFLEPEIISLEDVLVYGVSKRVEKITAAPAAVCKITELKLKNFSCTGQIPGLFADEPGIDVVQNGINDFNINSRGFNRTLNRRVQVLQDNRETAMALLLAQEWNTVSLPLVDAGEMEFVRGPSSALYGANAFSGVINIKTPDPENIQGTRATVSLGELNSVRGNLRHAGFDGRWGYRITFGGFRSNTWSRSRDISQAELERNEYAGLTPEQLPLKDDDLSIIHGSGRLDYNFNDGSVITVESGVTQAEDQVFVTNIGRIQVDKVLRPWARLSFASERLFLQGDYNTRKTFDGHQRALATAEKFEENSTDFKFQFQHNIVTPGNKFRLVWGASHKLQKVDTRQTFTPDEYQENQSGLFAQVDFRVLPQIAIVAAARVDRSTLHKTQVSPKAALVYSPNNNHSFRLTFNRAFQTPNYAEFFLETLAGLPMNLASLEREIERVIERHENLEPGTLDLPLNFGDTPRLAFGNENLKVEKIQGWEFGYKSTPARQFRLTLALYYNRLTDFITDLLPGVNPAFPAYRLPAEITGKRRTIAQAKIDSATGTALTALPNGTEALVVSFTNTGLVNEWGMELGGTFRLTRELELRGSYTFFNYDIKHQEAGGLLLPNTPKHKFNLSAAYIGKYGIDAEVYFKYVGAFTWASGFFTGPVPAYSIVNLAAAYRLDAKIRLGLTVVNALNNKHYELFGGSVNGRRSVLTFSYKL